jgi:hypothetical protein
MGASPASRSKSLPADPDAEAFAAFEREMLKQLTQPSYGRLETYKVIHVGETAGDALIANGTLPAFRTGKVKLAIMRGDIIRFLWGRRIPPRAPVIPPKARTAKQLRPPKRKTRAAR